jgi:CMP/dCMP kinase
VICPDAEVKIFVTASPEARARRRAAEFRAAGKPVDEAAVLDDIRKRDERDMHRAAAPLKQAEDAVLLDTTDLDIDGAIRAAIDIVEAVRAGRGRG